jgi:phosphomannomutase/phosphoglucomutase
MAIEIPKHIFREYDIRGVVGKDLTPGNVRKLGMAIAYVFSREKISSAVVGRDNRLSSDKFFDALTDGLTSGGIDVFDIGMVPTPVFYFATRKWGINGGVMITASHNPSEFNGFKVLQNEGTIYGDDILELHEITNKVDEGPGGGKVVRRDVKGEYVEYLAENMNVRRNVRFAVDGGNGTSGIVTKELFSSINLNPVELYMEPDGNYPNHHPDPTVVTNLSDLKSVVVKNGLELGIGFDGDSDRIGVIDDRGEILWGDRLLALFARDVIGKNPGAAVIFDVKCSQSLEQDIIKNGGKPIMWKTGHSLIKKKMREEEALLAGEMSGHIFFADRYYGYDDALYAACRLIEIVSRSNERLSELLDDLPLYRSTPEIRVDCEDERKFDVVEEVCNNFKRTNEVIDVDGARVKFENGWGLVRASNTQPSLVLRFEATDEDTLQRIKDTFAEMLNKYIDVSDLKASM